MPSREPETIPAEDVNGADKPLALSELGDDVYPRLTGVLRGAPPGAHRSYATFPSAPVCGTNGPAAGSPRKLLPAGRASRAGFDRVRDSGPIGPEDDVSDIDKCAVSIMYQRDTLVAK